MNENTPEYADVTDKRVLATLVDYTIVFSLTFAYIWFAGDPNEEGGRTVSGFPAFIPVVLWFAWFILSEACWGATPGHALVGLKLIAQNGNDPSLGQIVKRRVCNPLEISWCFGLVAFLLVRHTATKQRLGDLVSQTIVVPRNYRPKRFGIEVQQNVEEMSR